MFLKDLIGQEKLKQLLVMALLKIKNDNDLKKHILLIGPAGMGKTAFAQAIADELNFDFLSFVGNEVQENTIKKFIEIRKNTVVFIDEIHTLDKKIVENLYNFLSGDNINYKLTYVENRKTYEKVLNLPAPPILFVAATTDYAKLTKPLLSRFPYTFYMENYTEEEIGQIVLSKFPKLSIESVIKVIKRSRLNPRIALSLATYFNDHLTVFGNENIDENLLPYNADGLSQKDLEILKIIYEFGKVSLNSLASILNESPENILKVYEPYLLKQKLVEIVPGGRKLTQLGQMYIKHILDEDYKSISELKELQEEVATAEVEIRQPLEQVQEKQEEISKTSELNVSEDQPKEPEKSKESESSKENIPVTSKSSTFVPSNLLQSDGTFVIKSQQVKVDNSDKKPIQVVIPMTLESKIQQEQDPTVQQAIEEFVKELKK